MNFEMFLVGGILRDRLIGKPSKDVDFSAVLQGLNEGFFPSVEDAFQGLEDFLTDRGFEIFERKPENGTIRAKVPRGDALGQFGSNTADFVLARKEGPYSDGRRPDWVEVGTLTDDLNRRDLTVNAMAAHWTTPDKIIDLHNGQRDLEARELRFVGCARDRLIEDALRVLRVLRFVVTKGFTMPIETRWAIENPEVARALLYNISEERKQAELSMMLKHDTLATMRLLATLHPNLQEAIFSGRVRLDCTLKD